MISPYRLRSTPSRLNMIQVHTLGMVPLGVGIREGSEDDLANFLSGSLTSSLTASDHRSTWCMLHPPSHPPPPNFGIWKKVGRGAGIEGCTIPGVSPTILPYFSRLTWSRPCRSCGSKEPEDTPISSRGFCFFEVGGAWTWTTRDLHDNHRHTTESFFRSLLRDTTIEIFTWLAIRR